MVGQLTVV